MAENYFLEGFKSIGESIGAFYVKNKAHIFTGLGIGGTVATGVLSAKDGARSARKIDRKAMELCRPLTWKEKIQLCWKDYIDAVAVGALACFSEFKSDQINTRTIADRTALLIASEKAYEKLSAKTKEVLGEKKAHQVQDEVAKEKVQANVTPEKLESATAFRSGNGDLYPFMDGYSEILFYSNIDYLRRVEMELQRMMDDLAPRKRENDYYDKKVGVPYSEFLERINVPKKEWSSPERRDRGWNKGFAPDGSDDDPITFYTTTVEHSPGFAVTVINWEKDPTDMKLGRLIKSSGLA